MTSTLTSIMPSIITCTSPSPRPRSPTSPLSSLPKKTTWWSGCRFDSIINTYLITHCSFSPQQSRTIGVVVHSSCNYFGSVAFPAMPYLGLRVSKLGRSSVTYEVGVFERGQEEVKVVGGYTHVFVDREGRKVNEEGMEKGLREGLRSLLGRGEVMSGKL